MKTILIAAFGFLPAMASAYPRILETGVYKGFGPTDESAVAMGEVQIDVVTDRIATLQYATGLVLRKSHFDLSQLVALTPSENRELGFKNMAAFRPMNGGYPIIVLNHSFASGLLSKIPNILRTGVFKTLGIPALTIYTGGMGDMMMPLMLYSPSQVSRGKFDKAITRIEKQFGKQGIIPRVGFNGRAMNNETCTFLLHTQGNLDSAKTH